MSILLKNGGDDRNRTGVQGFADLCLSLSTTSPLLEFLHGAQTRNRTTDTGIFSPLLYRLSYLGLYGGSDGARTRDLWRDRPAL